VAVAPAAPAAGEVALSLFLFLAYIVAAGLLWVYRSTLSRILLGLADEIDDAAISTRFVTIRPLAPLAAALRFVDGNIRAGLGLAATNTERGALLLFHLAARQLDRLGDAIGGLAFDVAQALTHALDVTVPNAIYAAQRGLLHRIRAAEATAAAAAVAGTQALHRFEGVITGRVGGLTRDVTALKRRLLHAERALAGAGAAVLVGAALTRLGFKWLRCRNVGRLAKRACAADVDFIESLIAGSLLFYGTVSIVEFAHELQALEAEGVAAIRRLVREA
jgi:hypothetical protein